jgi:hypothetical protein
MEKFNRIIVLIAVLGILAFSRQAVWAGPMTLGKKELIKPKGLEPRLPIDERRAPRLLPHAERECPDPAAFQIDFRLVSRETEFRGRVEIWGIVKNVGGTTFEPRFSQEVHLYEINPGGRPRLVHRIWLEEILPGNWAPVVYARNWNMSSPAEGEFPPTYRLVIPYVSENGDCETANNQLERSGADIRAMFY